MIPWWSVQTKQLQSVTYWVNKMSKMSGILRKYIDFRWLIWTQDSFGNERSKQSRDLLLIGNLFYCCRDNFERNLESFFDGIPKISTHDDLMNQQWWYVIGLKVECTICSTKVISADNYKNVDGLKLVYKSCLNKFAKPWEKKEISSNSQIIDRTHFTMSIKKETWKFTLIWHTTEETG